MPLDHIPAETQAWPMSGRSLWNPPLKKCLKKITLWVSFTLLAEAPSKTTKNILSKTHSPVGKDLARTRINHDFVFNSTQVWFEQLRQLPTAHGSADKTRISAANTLVRKKIIEYTQINVRKCSQHVPDRGNGESKLENWFLYMNFSQSGRTDYKHAPSKQ